MAFPVEPQTNRVATRLTLRVLLDQQGPELRQDGDFPALVVFGFAGAQTDDLSKEVDWGPWRITELGQNRVFFGFSYHARMRDVVILFIHLIVTVVRLARPGGLRSVVAESVLLKHQLRILNRSRKRAPKPRAAERIIAGLCTLFMNPTRVLHSAIVLKPSTAASPPGAGRSIVEAYATRRLLRDFSNSPPTGLRLLSKLTPKGRSCILVKNIRATGLAERFF